MRLLVRAGQEKACLLMQFLESCHPMQNVVGKYIIKKNELTEERKVQLRGKEIAFIPQSVNYLDPLMRVGKQVKIGIA